MIHILFVFLDIRSIYDGMDRCMHGATQLHYPEHITNKPEPGLFSGGSLTLWFYLYFGSYTFCSDIQI